MLQTGLLECLDHQRSVVPGQPDTYRVLKVNTLATICLLCCRDMHAACGQGLGADAPSTSHADVEH